MNRDNLSPKHPMLVMAVFGVLAAGPAQASGPDAASAMKGPSRDSIAISRAGTHAGPPWSAIGRVNRRPGGFCTGVLIAPEKVLTTANCVWNRSLGRWHASEDLYFLAGYNLGTHVVMRRVISIGRAENIRMKRNGFPRRAMNDWAVLTLRNAIAPSPAIRPIETLALGSGARPQHLGPLVRAGFGPTRPHALSRAACRAIAYLNRSVVMHDCGATYSDAGFPILVRTPAGWRLLGLQMMTYLNKAPRNGLGMALVVPSIKSAHLRQTPRRPAPIQKIRKLSLNSAGFEPAQSP